MKKKTDSFEDRVPVVHYNSELDKYDDVVLFPHKVAKAKELLKKYGLPDMSRDNKEQSEINK